MRGGTLVMMMFSGLMSRWAMPFWCRQWTASQIMPMELLVSDSLILPLFVRFSWPQRVPPSRYSSSRQMLSSSSKRPNSRTTYACSMKSWIFTYRMNCSIRKFCRIVDLAIFFIAKTEPVALWTATFTEPNRPSPSFFPNAKSESYTFFYDCLCAFGVSQIWKAENSGSYGFVVVVVRADYLLIGDFESGSTSTLFSAWALLEDFFLNCIGVKMLMSGWAETGLAGNPDLCLLVRERSGSLELSPTLFSLLWWGRLTADLGTCSTTSVLNLSSKRYMMSVLFCILLLLNSFSRSISLYNCPSPRFASLALDFDWYRVLPSISAGQHGPWALLARQVESYSLDEKPEGSFVGSQRLLGRKEDIGLLCFGIIGQSAFFREAVGPLLKEELRLRVLSVWLAQVWRRVRGSLGMCLTTSRKAFCHARSGCGLDVIQLGERSWGARRLECGSVAERFTEECKLLVTFKNCLQLGLLIIILQNYRLRRKYHQFLTKLTYSVKPSKAFPAHLPLPHQQCVLLGMATRLVAHSGVGAGGRGVSQQQVIIRSMGLQIDAEIFRWLQGMHIVKEGKRTPSSAVEISEHATAKFFDGLYVSHIVKAILKERGLEEAVARLSAIKENSTPAIRLYNWNLLSDALKILGQPLDYGEKSKLLNLEAESIQRVLRYLFSIRVEREAAGEQKLQVETSVVGQKTFREAANIFQFLVISIGNHFKLSVQHTLNLFLDDNKYLAHLLVKGVKNEFDPILCVLDDVATHLPFIVESLFCVDERESVTFLLNALKPCLISKSPLVAQRCLSLLKEVYETYIQKGVDAVHACEWMEKEGINTIFFSIKRHQELFQEAIAIAYAYLEEKLFRHIEPQEKSLLWNSELEKVTFFRELVTTSHSVLLDKFLESAAFSEWNRHCLKALKKSKNPQELFLLIAIYESLWCSHSKFFEEGEGGMPNAYIAFLKNCALLHSEIIFTQAVRTLFHLLIFLGTAKNSFAPLVYKTLVSILTFQDQKDRIEFLLLNFSQAFRSIPALPAAPLAQPLVKHLQVVPSVSLIEMAKAVLVDPKLKEEQAEDILESLAKAVFEDIQFGAVAVEAMMAYLSRENSEDLLDSYCKAALGHFVSTSKQLFRTLRQLKQDHEKYRSEESMRRGEPSFLRNVHKYLILGNLILLLQKSIAANARFKEDAEPMIFHTYLKLSKEMRKDHIARLLMPILEAYYEEDGLPAKIKEYDSDLQESITSPLRHAQSEQVSQVFETPSPKKEKRLRAKETLRTEENESVGKSDAVESVRKELEGIKKRRELQREKSIEMSRELDLLAQKKELYRSIVNEKRIIEFGKKHELDYDYKYLHDFDSVKPEVSSIGLPNIRLLNLQQEEEPAYAEDVETFIRKYRKVWRFLFFKYSSLGAIRPKQEPAPQEKINMSEVWRMLRDYEFDVVKREESQALIRKVNEASKRKHDPQNLTYLGFEDYLLQLSCFAYSRLGYPHLPPARQLALLLEQMRTVTASKGSGTDMFDNPDEVYFQETEVIREFNRRLADNPDYVLPEGYKKVKQAELVYGFGIVPAVRGVKKSYQDVLEVVNEILWERMQMHVLEPLTSKVEKCLARPVLFQKMKEKLKDYAGGYLMPKRSVDLRKLSKEVSPVKVEYHLMPNFSLGIKLGLAGVDIKLRYIADEVAFWLDDALDAVQAGKLHVINKSKVKVDNELIRRKRSEAYQIKLESIEQEKKERMRAETVKNDAKKYVEDREAAEQRRREGERKQRQERKAKEEKQLKRKLQEFQEAKSKLQAKRREVQEKKEAEVPMRKKEKEEYRRNVEDYFKKKKEELQEKEKTLKANREWDAKQETQKKSKEIERKKRLEIEVFRKEEEVLQKIVESRQSYEEIWRSPDIQEDLQDYRPRLKLIFDLLLRYQKSKVSLTAQDEIGFNTLNFFALRTYIAPFLLPKNSLALMYRSSVRGPGETKSGLNYVQFEELLFKIAVKAKDILNKRKNGPSESQLQESEIPQLPSLRSSPELDRKKKSLTDQYALDAIGVEPSTLKRLMDFIVLPFDKKEAEERFRTMLQNTSSLPTSLVLKQAQNFLDSIP